MVERYNRSWSKATVGRLSHWWNSLFGYVKCKACGKRWPCHLAAWGDIYGGPSTCAVCGERAIYWGTDED